VQGLQPKDAFLGGAYPIFAIGEDIQSLPPGVIHPVEPVEKL